MIHTPLCHAAMEAIACTKLRCEVVEAVIRELQDLARGAATVLDHDDAVAELRRIQAVIQQIQEARP